ncbi:hypothetical protein HMPREF0308_1321 [Corynebacterium striatum ATCC 6940]|nr:hypothetical protein HMPREF0308_1321 [Corynebacterium striatum ATCC 6940]
MPVIGFQFHRHQLVRWRLDVQGVAKLCLREKDGRHRHNVERNSHKPNAPVR